MPILRAMPTITPITVILMLISITTRSRVHLRALQLGAIIMFRMQVFLLLHRLKGVIIIPFLRRLRPCPNQITEFNLIQSSCTISLCTCFRTVRTRQIIVAFKLDAPSQSYSRFRFNTNLLTQRALMSMKLRPKGVTKNRQAYLHIWNPFFNCKESSNSNTEEMYK